MRVKENKIREHRIKTKATVDTYGSEERALGWHCYLEDTLDFPFYARCTITRKISPLVKGEVVKIIGMAPENDCMHEIFVIVSFDGRSMAVPLSQLKPLRASLKIREAVGDWHYWVVRGYEF